MKILFVCMNNRFRSKIAEAYFNRTNKKIKAESAGVFEGSPMSKKTRSVVKQFGITLKGKPRGMSNKLLYDQDLVIITADNVPKSLFKGKAKKVIAWKIPDCADSRPRSVRVITEKIIKKIDKLNKQLGNK